MSELAKSTSLSGNALVDGLMLGGAWSGEFITYNFIDGDINSNGFKDFDEGDWKDFYRDILSNVESFANIKFREVSGRGNINFRLDEGGGGESGVPLAGTGDVETAVGINSDVAGAAAVVRLGTYSVTWFHEIGHALGLKHTHEEHSGGFPKLPGVVDPGDLGKTYLNTQINTVMSYTWSFLAEDNPFTSENDFGMAVNAQPGSFGAIDIAALQYLYGTHEYNPHNNIYKFNDNVDFNHGYTTIWDTGGTDTIEYTGSSRAKIDLRDASLQNEIGGGGWISTSETLTGGFTIAHGVTIEIAKGNIGDDILIGNAGANKLYGDAGNDYLDGGLGVDTMVGGIGDDTYRVDNVRDVVVEFAGSGIDTVEASVSFTLSGEVENLTLIGSLSINGVGNELANALTGNAGNNNLLGGAGADTLRGDGGNDTLFGGAGNDTLYGGDGLDRLDGGLGFDTMAGGTGNDTYVVDNVGDVVVEYAGQGTDVVQTSVSYTLSTEVENLTLTGMSSIDGTGNVLANVLTGNAGDNHLLGRAGNDTLYGGAGNDTLDGGTGFDTFYGGTGDDTYIVDVSTERVIELAGEGTDAVLASVTFKLQGNLENLTLMDTGSIDGTGNFQSNILIGNSAANYLDGSGGKDVLTGGGGNDTFVFRKGETNGDKVMDFTGASAAGGDLLEFYGFGTGATLSHTAGTDLYTIKADAAHGGLSETFQLVGVTNLDILAGQGHDVLLVA